MTCDWIEGTVYVAKHSEGRHRFGIKIIDDNGQEVILADYICDECYATMQKALGGTKQ